MVRKLLMLVALGVLLAPIIFYAAQAQDRGDEEEALYLSIPATGPDGKTFLGLVNLGPEPTELTVESFSQATGEPAVVTQRTLTAGGAKTFEIPSSGPDGRTLLLRAAGKMEAMAVLGSRDGQISEVIAATRPLREIAFPLLPAPQSVCTLSSGPREARLQLFNPGSLEARVEVRGLAAEGREVGVVSLPPLLPQEHRAVDVAEVFSSASSTLPVSVRVSSDRPLVGLQWRFTESDLAALPGLQTAREWQIPPAKALTGAVTASLWLFNPGGDTTVLSIEGARQGTALSASLRPGELREVAATGWMHQAIRVLSDNPVAAYTLYRSASGCGWSTASARPGSTLPIGSIQPIEIEVSADGNQLAAWPSFFQGNRGRHSEPHIVGYGESGAPGPPSSAGSSAVKSVLTAPAAVTNETLSFRSPVDEISVSAYCGLGGVCAGSDTDRHTAVDYGTQNTNPPAFASNFGTLRRTIDFNQNVGCGSLSCNMGNSVVIEYLQTNGEKWLSLDSHLAAKNVSGSGGRIAKGQRIGMVGCSGATLCSWCTNSVSSCTTYGNGTSYNKHAHHEHKLPNLGTLDLWPYGYMNFSEANQLKKPNESSITIAEALSRAFTTVDALRSRGIRVLVPFFSPFTSSPGSGNYEVYGVAGNLLNATLTLTPTTGRTFTNIGVGGRVWNNESSNMDFPLRASESIGANETRTLSGARTFTAGDYNFYAYETALGRGYSLKLAVLPNASSVVIDNDGRSGYVASEAGAQTVPGYYLSARLFQGGSANWAQWRPGKTGLFEIWAHVPSGATASQVSYKIYADGNSYILSSPVSQAIRNDQWVKLTSASIQSWTLSSTGYVGLSVQNVPSSEWTGVDAIKFIYLGAVNNGVPVAPSNLSASTDFALRAILFWNDNSSNETGFKIERKLGASGAWSQIATLGAGATGSVDTGLSPSTNYVYRVRATNGIGDSAYSNEASITTVAGSCSSSASTITSGQSLAGNLSSSDCFSSERTSSYYDRFAFVASGGVAYTITMTSATFDTYLVLKTASGTVVATNDDADATNSRILYTPSTSGTYVIEATSYVSRATGSYTVSLSSSGGNGGVPAAPSNLSASTDSALRAILFWNDNSSNETGFKIERKLGASGAWSQIATLGAGSTGSVDTGLSPSTNYVYRVRATNGVGDSVYSNEASITTVAGSCSSSTSTITSGQSLAGSLSSSDCFSSARTSSYYDRFAFVATGGVSYTITMTSAIFDTYLVLKTASGTVVATNDDADATNSRILYTPSTSGTYVIEATSYTSRATGSYTVSLSSSGGNGGVPAAPSNLSASTDSALRAILFWSDNSSNETGFKIERKLGASGAWSQIATLGAGSTGSVDTGLSPSTNYVYRVRATNGVGDSAYSNEASITTVAGSCSSSTSTITSGQSLAGSLSSSDCFSSARTSSYYDRFAFVATGGVSYTITMTSAIFDTYLVLKTASGTVVATNDDADATNSRILYTPPTSGTYVIEATSYTSRATGSYTVSLSSR